MLKEQEEVFEILSDLQDSLSEKNSKISTIYLDYSGTHFYYSINLRIYTDKFSVKVTLYDSENNNRKFIEEINEYEPLKPYLLKQIKKFKKLVRGLEI